MALDNSLKILPLASACRLKNHWGCHNNSDCNGYYIERENITWPCGNSKFLFECSANRSRVSAANEQNYFSTREEKFRISNDHVVFSSLLIYPKYFPFYFFADWLVNEMASFPHKRSFSATDVHELKKQCCSSQNPNLTTPMDISAAVGYGNKTDIFNIHRSKGRMIVSFKFC